MRRSKSARPQVEGLESLVFLSAGMNLAALRAGGGTSPMELRGATADQTRPDLSGNARGSYKLQLAQDGSSGTFQIQGIGTIRGLGPARVSAAYAADQTSAPDTMTFTLTGRRGTLDLRVARAPGSTDPDASTARLRYQVVSATGAYAGATGTGVLDLTLRPQARTFGATGQMSLTLRPDAA